MFVVLTCLPSGIKLNNCAAHYFAIFHTAFPNWPSFAQFQYSQPRNTGAEQHRNICRTGPPAQLARIHVPLPATELYREHSLYIDLKPEILLQAGIDKSRQARNRFTNGQLEDRNEKNQETPAECIRQISFNFVYAII